MANHRARRFLEFYQINLLSRDHRGIRQKNKKQIQSVTSSSLENEPRHNILCNGIDITKGYDQ